MNKYAIIPFFLGPKHKRKRVLFKMFKFSTAPTYSGMLDEIIKNETGIEFKKTGKHTFKYRPTWLDKELLKENQGWHVIFRFPLSNEFEAETDEAALLRFELDE